MPFYLTTSALVSGKAATPNGSFAIYSDTMSNRDPDRSIVTAVVCLKAHFCYAPFRFQTWRRTLRLQEEVHVAQICSGAVALGEEMHSFVVLKHIIEDANPSGEGFLSEGRTSFTLCEARPAAGSNHAHKTVYSNRFTFESPRDCANYMQAALSTS